MDSSPVMKGWLCKRYFRVNRWSERYFVLVKDKLVYYTTEDTSKESRGNFELVKGCYISQITEVDAPTKQLKKKLDKMYSLTILWPDTDEPPTKKKKSANSGANGSGGGFDVGSDGEYSDNDLDSGNEADTAVTTGNQSAHDVKHEGGRGETDPSSNINHQLLQQHNNNLPWSAACSKAVGESLVKRAAMHASFVKQRCSAAPTLEHNKKQHDQAVMSGAMVAGAAAGGAVVGAFTMGIGLIPYMAIVGGAAAVGGGTVAYHASSPIDRRLVLTARTLQEARRWKVALESAVALREGRRPSPLGLTASLDSLKLAIAWNADRICTWHCAGTLHGLRLLHCVPKPRPPPSILPLNGGGGGRSDAMNDIYASSASAAAAAAATPRLGEDEESWRLVAEGVCNGGSRRTSVTARAPPLDIFLTLMAALNGITPEDKNMSSFTANASIPNNHGHGFMHFNQSPQQSNRDRELLANSIFASIFGRVVYSIHNLKKLDDHSDILHIRFLHSHGNMKYDKEDPQDGLGRYWNGLCLVGRAIGVGLSEMLGLRFLHSSSLASLNHNKNMFRNLLSDGDNDGNVLFYSPLNKSGMSSSFWSSALSKLLSTISGKAPRELVVERFWRVDEDGCFIITLSSTEDQSSGWLPPLDSDQHARAKCNIVIVISPRRDYTSYHTRECFESKIEVTVSGGSGGAAEKLRTLSSHNQFGGLGSASSSSSSVSSTRKKAGTLPRAVADVAGDVLRSAAADLDESFQLSIMKCVIDLKETIEALEIAPPELVLASPSLASLSSSTIPSRSQQHTDSGDHAAQKQAEDSMKRSGVWQLAQTLAPLAPPPTIIGTGCPLNCGACGACDAFASDVFALSQAPPLYPSSRAPGFYFLKSSDEGEDDDEEDKKVLQNMRKKKKNKKKNFSHHHHHHQRHSQEIKKFENVWDDDGISTDEDDSSSSSSSDEDDDDSDSEDEEEEDDDEDSYEEDESDTDVSDTGESGTNRGDRRLSEIDLLDENGELMVGSDDEHLFEHLISDDDDDNWASALLEMESLRAKDVAIGALEKSESFDFSEDEDAQLLAKVEQTLSNHRISSPTLSSSSSSPSSSQVLTPTETPEPVKKNRWGRYGVFGRSRRNKVSKANPSTSTDLLAPTVTPLLKTVSSTPNTPPAPGTTRPPLNKAASYRSWTSRSKPASKLSPKSSKNQREVSPNSRTRSSSGGDASKITSSSSLPRNTKSFYKSRSLSIEREDSKLSNSSDDLLKKSIIEEQEMLREYISLKEKEALTLEQNIAHGPLVVAVSKTQGGGGGGSTTSSRMHLVSLQSILSDISAAKKKLDEHINVHGVMIRNKEKDLPLRRSYRERLKRAIVRRVQKRNEKRQKRKEAKMKNALATSSKDIQTSEMLKKKKKKKYWGRGRAMSKKKKKEQHGSANSSNKSSLPSHKVLDQVMPLYPMEKHRKLLDRNDALLFSEVPTDATWKLVYAFRSASTSASAMLSPSTVHTVHCLPYPSHWMVDHHSSLKRKTRNQDSLLTSLLHVMKWVVILFMPFIFSTLSQAF